MSNRNIGIPNRSGAVLLSSQGRYDGDELSSLDFESGQNGIDFSVYDSLLFRWINVNPATDGTQLTFQASTAGHPDTPSYAIKITSAPLVAYHDEADSATFAGYDSSPDQNADATAAFQQISRGIGNGAVESASGEMIVYGIRSAFAKQFRSVSNLYLSIDYTRMDIIHGYLQTASPLKAFQFKMGSGDFHGVINCYGILP